MNLFRRFRVAFAASVFAVSAFAMIGNASATSSGTDFTDIWWNPLKSGMGFQMINTGTFIFATGFVYGPNGQPTWFYANLNQTVTGSYTGNLGVATGPYFGGAFNPNNVIRRVAGTMTFVPTSVSAGQLSYSIDGVFANESVERQPLTLDDYNGTYLAVVTQTSTGCLNPANNGSATDVAAVKISQIGQSMAIVTTNPKNVSCTSVGTYSQLGRSGTFQSTYTCTDGDSGNAGVFEMNNRYHQFNARTTFVSSPTGCTIQGRITGLIPD
jgi:hypothetical protein